MAWKISVSKLLKVMSTFTGFLKSTVMRINEARDLGEMSVGMCSTMP
jgi:hypothetical protein